MGETKNDVPVHDSLRVVKATTLYQAGEWWKAVVTYGFESDSEATETAVYLWHKNGGSWTRKNKYVVKTPEAWAADRELIDQFIQSDRPLTETTAFPVSDYYTIGVGETVFQTDEWWKAIVNVTEKGTYETNEVMVYLWQERDGEWRRRQKYTIKSVSNWEEEREVIDEHLSPEESAGMTEETTNSTEGVTGELTELNKELDAHLSGEFT